MYGKIQTSLAKKMLSALLGQKCSKSGCFQIFQFWMNLDTKAAVRRRSKSRFEKFFDIHWE